MGGVAFVTGASSGIGRGLALRLAREGYAVALAARRAERLEALAETVREDGGRALACPCDVTVRAEVRDALRSAAEELGPVDLLVANAGVSEVTDVETLDAEDVERLLRVNFLGAVYAVEEVLPGMLERRRGHLVAVGSLAGYGGLPRTAAYSASKGALHNFFESLRIDLRGSGVDVTLVTPGYVDTPMTEVNEHPMPFLVDVSTAVEKIVGAIRRRRPLLAFPRPLSTLVRTAQIFPRRLYDHLASRVRREKRIGDATFSGTAGAPNFDRSQPDSRGMDR